MPRVPSGSPQRGTHTEDTDCGHDHRAEPGNAMFKCPCAPFLNTDESTAGSSVKRASCASERIRGIWGHMGTLIPLKLQSVSSALKVPKPGMLKKREYNWEVPFLTQMSRERLTPPSRRSCVNGSRTSKTKCAYESRASRANVSPGSRFAQTHSPRVTIAIPTLGSKTRLAAPSASALA